MVEQWTYFYVDGERAGSVEGWHFPPVGTGVSLHGEHSGVQLKVARLWWNLDSAGHDDDYVVRVELERV